MGKGEYKESVYEVIWWKSYVYKYVNVKMTTWNNSGMGGGGDKGEWWREWIQLWYILRTFVNVTMYPQCKNNNKNTHQ
jgi:hypothetical protein